jgi:hypothetical protein
VTIRYYITSETLKNVDVNEIILEADFHISSPGTDEKLSRSDSSLDTDSIVKKISRKRHVTYEL